MKRLSAEQIIEIIDHDQLLDLVQNNVNQVSVSIALKMTSFLTEPVYDFEQIVECSEYEDGWTILSLFYEQLDFYIDELTIEDFIRFLPLDERSMKEQRIIEKIFRKASFKFPDLIVILYKEEKVLQKEN